MLRTKQYKAILKHIEHDRAQAQLEVDVATKEIENLNSHYQKNRTQYIKKNFAPVLTYLYTVNEAYTETLYHNYIPTGETLKKFESTDNYVLIWKGNIQYFTLLNYSTTKSNLRGEIKTFSLSMPLRKHLLASKNLNFLNDIILYDDKKVLAYSTDY